MIINGTSNNDELIAQQGDQVFGFAGDDTLDAANGDGNNILDGGSGNDKLFGNNNDTLIGGDGNDSLYAKGDSGNNILNGGAGEDDLYAEGNSGNNILNGGDDSDRLFVLEGDNNSLNGDAGDDELYVMDGSLNTLKGGVGNDFLQTLSITGNNTLEGGEGNDTLMGTLASDSLFGNDGNDLLYAGKQGTKMIGGNGFDRFYLGNGSVPDVPAEVLDFTKSDDKVVIAGIPQVHNFEDIILEQVGNDTIVKALIDSSEKNLGILRNVLSSDLDASNFDFIIPVFSITDAASIEGNDLNFTITRTDDILIEQTVTVSTSINTGDTASVSDFTAQTQTITFAQGETQKIFTVSSILDSLFESAETFTVTLSNPTNGSIISSTNGIAKGTINDEDIPLAVITNNSIFNVKGVGDTVRLKATLIESNSTFVNELGVFVVDNAEGRINGIAPGEQGYNEAAFDLAKTQSEGVFSAIANLPNLFKTDIETNSLTRLLEFDSGSYLQFFLVKDGTVDSFKAGLIENNNILFADSSNQIITQEEGNVTISWKENTTKTNFDSLVVKIESTDESLTIGTALQEESQAKLIDLRDISGLVKADFSVFREAAYNNEVYFYEVNNAQGQIGSLEATSANRANYLQAAINNLIKDAETGEIIKFAVSNQGQFTDSAMITGGSIFAPMIIINGTLSQLTDNNTGNDPQVYFPYLGVNSDGVDHIRLLADNTFGFEDLSGGGDLDYNDLIIKLNFTVQ
ncbi:DUF4114 domain-containing protein [Anabaena sp. UHCC 0253]|uniref:DUF4114 domain-containing protein n=1 Tax=Anabaena sp. UHCC 0253 TaxID=2590019 RepID=UPI001444E41E|nr:DUF4114 domain-containing protein [Anabaena sp. UHCC 0253]MTJ53228.1 DUF4114 domain-containing protein [Anabaena sp. UHCC 0253]